MTRTILKPGSNTNPEGFMHPDQDWPAGIARIYRWGCTDIGPSPLDSRKYYHPDCAFAYLECFGSS